MTRTRLLAATALAAAALLGTAPAHAQSFIQGGGATSSETDYFQEFALFNNGVAAGAATFNNTDGDNANDTLYWPSGSGTGQSAFLKDENGCNYAKVVLNSSTCSPTTVGGAFAVHYAASDSPFSAATVSSWATSPVGAPVAGHLIQIPSMGTGIAIPVVNSLVTKNGTTKKHKPVAGGTTLTDDDLCGIFSGKITDWANTSAGAVALGAGATVASGPITVAYRADSSGATYILLNHLTAVCTSANSNFTTLPVVASSTFLSLFPNSTPPVPPGATTTNFVGETLSSGEAGYLDNATGIPGAPVVTSAIGYVSPDWTTVDPGSDAILPNGTKSTLVVAAIKNGSLIYIPLVADLAGGLNHGKIFNPAGPTKPPTSASAGAQTLAYDPLIETTSSGYPIVAYATFDFAQCYADPNITQGILNFMAAHYNAKSGNAPIIARNGLVSINSTGAKAFATIIQGAILSNTRKWNDNIGNATACAGLSGR